MTTTVKIHVNGRYRATVKQDDRDPVIVDGNYIGSPNPSGEHSFYLAHSANSTFTVTEAYVPEEPVTEERQPEPAVEQPDPPAAKDDGQTA